jgi:hypothetical protein
MTSIYAKPDPATKPTTQGFTPHAGAFPNPMGPGGAMYPGASGGQQPWYMRTRSGGTGTTPPANQTQGATNFGAFVDPLRHLRQMPVTSPLAAPAGGHSYRGDDPNFKGWTQAQADEMNTPEYRQSQIELDYINTLPWYERGQAFNAMQNRRGIQDIMSGEQSLKGRALDNQAQQIANQLSMMQPFLGSLGDMFGGMGGWWEGGGPSGMFGEGGLGGWLRGVYGNEVVG